MTDSDRREPPVAEGADAAVHEGEGRDPHRKSPIRFSIKLVLIAGLAVAAWVGSIGWYLYDYNFVTVEPRAFSSAAWKKLSVPWKPSEFRIRRYMAEDLVANSDLMSMDRRAIDDLLGPGDPGEEYSENAVPYTYSYRLAPRIAGSCWLIISFDRRDVMESNSIVTAEEMNSIRTSLMKK